MVSKNGIGKKVMGAALSSVMVMSAIPAISAFASNARADVITIVVNPANEEFEAYLEQTEANFAQYAEYIPGTLESKYADMLQRGRFLYDYRCNIPNRDYYITQWLDEINEAIDRYKPAEQAPETQEQPSQNPDQDSSNPDENDYMVCEPLFFTDPAPDADATPEVGDETDVDASSVSSAAAPVNTVPEVYRDLMAEQFVDRLYLDGLARIADEDGRTGWLDQIITGQMSYGEVASDVFGSSEFSTRNLSDEEFVAVLYKVMFGRTASADEQAAWVETLASGTSRSEVVNAFVNSAEFKADYLF